MQAYLRRDPRRGQRWGLIVVTEVCSVPDPLFFSLQRFTDGRYLSNHCLWQSKRDMIRAEVHSWENHIVSISVGPDFLDELDAGTTYRMTLGKGASFPLTISSDLICEMQRRHEAEAGEVFLEEDPEEARRDHAHRPPRPWRVTAALACALLLAGGAGYLYWQDQQQTVIESKVIPFLQSTDSMEVVGDGLRAPGTAFEQRPDTEDGTEFLSGTIVSDQFSVSSQEEIVPAVPVRDPLEVRKSGGRKSMLDAFARRLNISVDDQDEALLALQKAAEGGSTEAMFMLAQYYDPLAAPSLDGVCNPLLAREWYHRAEKCGLAAAGIAAEALKQYLFEQAREGSEEALNALRLW